MPAVNPPSLLIIPGLPKVMAPNTTLTADFCVDPMLTVIVLFSLS